MIGASVLWPSFPQPTSLPLTTRPSFHH
jgi:hypothetical protein